jgi:hypothetical protein
LGLLWPCPQILRPDWKGFPRAHPLAFWASLSVMKEKNFITLTPGVNGLKKLLSSTPMLTIHKLLSVTGKNVWLSLILVIKGGSYPSGAYYTVGSWLNRLS